MSDYNITLRIFLRALLAAETEETFPGFGLGKPRGVSYNNDLVESFIGFAACSRNSFVRLQHY